LSAAPFLLMRDQGSFQLLLPLFPAPLFLHASGSFACLWPPRPALGTFSLCCGLRIKAMVGHTVCPLPASQNSDIFPEKRALWTRGPLLGCPDRAWPRLSHDEVLDLPSFIFLLVRAGHSFALRGSLPHLGHGSSSIPSFSPRHVSRPGPFPPTL